MREQPSASRSTCVPGAARVGCRASSEGRAKRLLASHEFHFETRRLPGAAPDQFDKPAGAADTRHREGCGGRRADAPAVVAADRNRQRRLGGASGVWRASCRTVPPQVAASRSRDGESVGGRFSAASRKPPQPAPSGQSTGRPAKPFDLTKSRQPTKPRRSRRRPGSSIKILRT
jgi:hypothetical protein